MVKVFFWGMGHMGFREDFLISCYLLLEVGEFFEVGFLFGDLGFEVCK